jgi:hypothetical protein
MKTAPQYIQNSALEKTDKIVLKKTVVSQVHCDPDMLFL